MPHPKQHLVRQWCISRLREVFAQPYQIEPIGSTVLGIKGKGIIDIVIYYPCPVQDTLKNDVKMRLIQPVVEILEASGWEYEYGKKQFPAHRPRYDIGITFDQAHFNVHCHLLPYGGEEMRKQRFFRQRLLQSPALRAEYVVVKETLIADGITDQLAYGRAKSSFIKRVLQEYAVGMGNQNNT